MQLSLLETKHIPAVFQLLQQDVEANLFLIDILMRRGISRWSIEEWRGIFVNQQLIAVGVSLGRLATKGLSRLLFCCGAPEACKQFGADEQARGGTRMIIGPRAASDAAYQGMNQPPARLHYDQRIYVCDEAPAGESLNLRYAKEKDYQVLFDFSAEMMREDLQQDPRIHDLEFHQNAVRSRIKNHKTLVAEIDKQICFVLDIGTYFRLGAQVGGTYVPPAFRRQGIASRGMRAANQWILRACDRVTLHVHEANNAAIRCYLNSGFRPSSPYRLIALQHGSALCPDAPDAKTKKPNI